MAFPKNRFYRGMWLFFISIVLDVPVLLLLPCYPLLSSPLIFASNLTALTKFKKNEVAQGEY